MHILHPTDTPEINDGEFVYRTLLPPEVGGKLAIYLLTVTHANPHSHDADNQIYIIQSGRGIIEIGAEQQEVEPGHLVYIPRGQRHSLTPLGAEPVVLYSIIQPLE
jgi:mannose-6-phosphate isomerase-like protein (cupin superfamily)